MSEPITPATAIPESGDYADLDLNALTTFALANEARKWVNDLMTDAFTELHELQLETKVSWKELAAVKLEISELRGLRAKVQDIANEHYHAMRTVIAQQMAVDRIASAKAKAEKKAANIAANQQAMNEAHARRVERERIGGQKGKTYERAFVLMAKALLPPKSFREIDAAVMIANPDLIQL